MGLLDMIFGNSDDDLENTQDAPAPTIDDVKETYTHPLESVPFFSRPMGSSTNDPFIGEDEVGNPMYMTNLGTTYTIKIDPDQRPMRQRIVEGVRDTAVAGYDAVSDYVQDPTLPTMEQVGDAAKAVAKGVEQSAEDLGDLMFKGQGTYGDVFGLAAGMPVATTGLKAAKLIDAPDNDGSTLGMFLPVGRRASATDVVDGAFKKDLDKANKMQLEGKSRDEIWEETGLFQLGDSDEWLREIDDSMSDIALTQKEFPKTQTITRDRKVSMNTTGRGTVAQIRAEANIEFNNLRDRVERGEITLEEAQDLAEKVQREANDKIAAAKATQSVTETVNVPVKPDVPLTSGKPGSTLDEVLNHPEVFDVVNRKTTTYQFPTAEAGRRKGSSAGESGVYGVAYPDTIQNRNYTYKKGKSMISSFTDAGNQLSREGRNDRDKFIIQSVKDGKMTSAQGRAELIWSTMLHETQHYLDDFFKSTSGRGFNTSGTDAVVRRVKEKYKMQMDAFKEEVGLAKMPEGVKLPKGKLKFVFDAYRTHLKAIDPNGPAKLPFEESERIMLDAMNLGDDVGRQVAKSIEGDPTFSRLYAMYSGIHDGRNAQLLDYIKSQGNQSAATRRYNIYIRELGEVKARLVQARRAMTPEERKKIPPYTMLDVPEEQTFISTDIYGTNVDTQMQGILSND